jgi:hypothetical protein
MATQAAIATLGSILKDLYLPPVVEQLNNEVLFLQRLEPRSQELVGNQAVVPLHKNRTGGIGSRGETDALPSAGNQGYARAVYDLKLHYGRVRVTGLAMAKTASEAGAFLQALKGELDGIRNDLKKDIARQTYGDGSGKVGAAASTANGAQTVTLTSDEPLRKGQIYIGMRIDIGTTANPTSILNGATGPSEVTDVNIAAKTVTVNTGTIGATTAGTHFIFRQGNLTGSTVNEMIGLQGLVTDTGTGVVGGIDSSAAGNSYWQNPAAASFGATLDAVPANGQDAIVIGFNTVNINGGTVSLLVGSFGIQRQVFKILQPKVQYIEPLNLKGGFKALEFMGQPLVADLDAPFGKLYLLDERFMKVFATSDWHFLDEDGHVLKWVSGFDAWEAVLARYMNLGISRRNTNYVIPGITDTTGV